MVDFKELPIDDALTRLNNHLLSLKEMSGRLEDNFKSGEFEFGYSLLKKTAKSLGIVVDGKNYTAYKIGEKHPEYNIVMLKQNNVKKELTKNNKPSQGFVKQQQYLTEDEIVFIKSLFAAQQESIVKDKQILVVPQMEGAKKTTGINVYVDVWNRWKEFKSKYGMYSGTDLMAMALEEFMTKYSGNKDGNK